MILSSGVRGLWLALVVALGSSCGPSDSDPGAGKPEAPAFDVERIGGGRLKLADLRGKLVLLDFWATWCVPCVQEIPDLNALYLERRDQGLAVVGLAVDDLEAEPMAAWLKERGIQYPVGRADSQLAGLYAAYTFPQHVLISADGRVLETLEPGYHSREELEGILAPHLARIAGG